MDSQGQRAITAAAQLSENVSLKRARRASKVSPASQKKERKERKSDRTRRRLLDAAMKVMGERGVAGLSVTAINEQAEVSQGTFYLYFKDRWDIIGQLIKDVTETIRAEMDARHVGAIDPAERVAYATQRAINYYVSNPDMGWVHVRLIEANTPEMRRLRYFSGQSLIDDLKYGIKRGRFLVQIDEFLLDGIRAIHGGAIRDLLNGSADKEIGDRATELILRMLGINESEARSLSRRYRCPE
jgi:AcrR family transcriptional regulator